jgi:hypothetical protein
VYIPVLRLCSTDISREKRTNLCSPGQLTRDYIGNSIFTCHISNYSDYVQVVVVEDDRIEYNESTRDLSFGCEAHAQDRSQATCTVGISSSLHSGKRDYQLCAGYNDSVVHTTPLRCSDTITVTFSGTSNTQSLTIGLIAGASVVFMLLLLVPLFICVVRHRRSSAASSSATLAVSDATRPLLHPSDDLTLQRDGATAGPSVKVTSPRKPTTPGTHYHI